MIPYGRQEICEADIQAVMSVLKSDFLTQGPAVPRFEQCVAEAVNAEYATAFNSATSALHASCIALDVGKGDLVWTSPNSFVASANCALYCGATVDFVDIDFCTRNMCIDALEDKLKIAKRKGTLPKALIVVHFSGNPCEMKIIKKLSETYGFKIIEDASHAVGAEYGNKKVGSCWYSDITVFSFHPVKIITSGEGGIATTNSEKLKEKLDLFRSHCITRSPDKFSNPERGGWYYEQLGLGYNYRMSDIQAALGFSQFQQLEFFLQERERVRARYDQYLSQLPLTLPKVAKGTRSSWHIYVVNFQGRNAKELRAYAFKEMRSRGIGVNVHYIPIHLQPYYADFGFKRGDYPSAEKYYDSAITIPIFPSLSEREQNHVIRTLKEITE
tara:strand:+ start:4997 stop:6154 length:1158 start_codon:yes stop_codon:yes gene_type:complete